MASSIEANAQQNLDVVLAWLHSRLSELGIDLQLAHDCNVIVDEYVANLNMHGSDHSPSPLWSLEVLRTNGDLLLRFRDNCGKFDPTQHRTSILEESEVDGSNGGLGLLLIKELSDVLEYRHCDGQNCLDVKIHLRGKS